MSSFHQLKEKQGMLQQQGFTSKASHNPLDTNLDGSQYFGGIKATAISTSNGTTKKAKATPSSASSSDKPVKAIVKKKLKPPGSTSYASPHSSSSTKHKAKTTPPSASLAATPVAKSIVKEKKKLAAKGASSSSAPRAQVAQNGIAAPPSSAGSKTKPMKSIVKKKKKKLSRNTDRKPPSTSKADLAKMLRERCKLRLDDFDSRFDYTYDSKSAAKFAGQRRGGEMYMPPKGFSKIGLNMKKRYPNSSDKWLKKNEWAIVYHGTRARPTYIQSIIRNGFMIRGGKESATNGERFGEGVYCSPDPEYAVRYARKHKLDSQHGDEFVIVFQCRVKPGEYIKEREYSKGDNEGAIWRVNDPRFIRPYAVLLSDDAK